LVGTDVFGNKGSLRAPLFFGTAAVLVPAEGLVPSVHDFTALRIGDRFLVAVMFPWVDGHLAVYQLSSSVPEIVAAFS
jgi:hypothetical protein